MKKLISLISLILILKTSLAPSYSNINIKIQKELIIQLKKQKLYNTINSFLDNIPKIERDYFKKIIWKDKYLFYKTIQIVSDSLNIKPQWLMLLFYYESRFNPKAKNKINAVGMMQIIPSTAQYLNTTTKEILEMDRVDQIWLAYKYFKYCPVPIKSFTDLYLFCFFPKALKKDNNYILSLNSKKINQIALLNTIFDLNNDNKLKKAEIIKCIENLKKY